jgi:mutator protein MutT
MQKPVVKVVAALIFDENGHLLITKRNANAHLGGLWEFPGGRLEAGETPQQALIREISEEVDLNIEVDSFFWHEIEEYESRIIDISFYNCRMNPPRQRISPKDVADYQWIQPEKIDEYTFPKADLKLVKLLKSKSFKPIESY